MCLQVLSDAHDGAAAGDEAGVLVHGGHLGLEVVEIVRHAQPCH